jgi:hypothetical protein
MKFLSTAICRKYLCAQTHTETEHTQSFRDDTLEMMKIEAQKAKIILSIFLSHSSCLSLSHVCLLYLAKASSGFFLTKE